MKLPINNLSYPVKIIVGDSTGSGFFVKNDGDIYLISAKHVIYKQGSLAPINEKLKIIAYAFLDAEIQTTPHIYDVDISILTLDGNIGIDPSLDIVVIKLGSENETNFIKFIKGWSISQNSNGALIHYNLSGARKFNEIEITNDVFVLGYPTSLSSADMGQLDYDAPLVRKGIIGGKNQNNKTIILDCPVYGGNSGGMVLEINHGANGAFLIHLVGVVVQFVPYVDLWQNVRTPNLINTSYQNSGYSIALPVDFIFTLIEKIENNLLISAAV